MSEPQRIEIHLPGTTILKVLLAALGVWAFLRLWPELVYLCVSLLLATALERVVVWMEQRGASRGTSVLILAIVLLLLICSGIAFVLPPLADQVVQLVSDFPSLRQRVQLHLPGEATTLQLVIEQIFLLPSSPEVAAGLNQPLFYGRAAVSGLMTTGIVLIVTLYLLLDGKRIYAWLLAYVPRRHRDKMAATIPEMSDVVNAYVRGQLFISLMFTIFLSILLTGLNVPAVLPLAVLAGICDVIPVVGIIIATAPAALLALTVSPGTSAIVAFSCIFYHLFETYFVAPRVYGNRLRLSTLTVILALIIGGTLQGVIGAVLVLPMVAAYPIFERIWLKGYLKPEVIADHVALAKAARSGNDQAIEVVLSGEKHPGERSSVLPEPPVRTREPTQG